LSTIDHHLGTTGIRGVARSKNVGWTHMASAEREPITGVWGRPPAEFRGRALVRGQGAKPPEAENLLAFGCPAEAANLPHSSYFANSRYL